MRRCSSTKQEEEEEEQKEEEKEKKKEEVEETGSLTGSDAVVLLAPRCQKRLRSSP